MCTSARLLRGRTGYPDRTEYPLALVEGATENATLACGLLVDLRELGLDAVDARLVMLIEQMARENPGRVTGGSKLMDSGERAAGFGFLVRDGAGRFTAAFPHRRPRRLPSCWRWERHHRPCSSLAPPPDQEEMDLPGQDRAPADLRRDP